MHANHGVGGRTLQKRPWLGINGTAHKIVGCRIFDIELYRFIELYEFYQVSVALVLFLCRPALPKRAKCENKANG